MLTFTTDDLKLTMLEILSNDPHSLISKLNEDTLGNIMEKVSALAEKDWNTSKLVMKYVTRQTDFDYFNKLMVKNYLFPTLGHCPFFSIRQVSEAMDLYNQDHTPATWLEPLMQRRGDMFRSAIEETRNTHLLRAAFRTLKRRDTVQEWVQLPIGIRRLEV